YILQGKNKADYTPNLPGANTVRITNVAQVKMTGNKRAKVYYHHTGYMGHLKELTYEQQFERDPKKVVEKAIFNMLPKNRLRQRWMNRLKIEV
ncbi:MAG: 50S ribosomal protein L13, partial [Candidatus Harrisonbacteria bacterium CG10_big_fil_rev_8_21_14_0_10_49_15]